MPPPARDEGRRAIALKPWQIYLGTLAVLVVVGLTTGTLAVALGFYALSWVLSWFLGRWLQRRGTQRGQ